MLLDGIVALKNLGPSATKTRRTSSRFVVSDICPFAEFLSLIIFLRDDANREAENYETPTTTDDSSTEEVIPRRKVSRQQ
jgi:hypothetical protein